MSCPFLFGLFGKYDIGMMLQGGSHKVGTMSDNHYQSISTSGASGIENIFDHRPPATTSSVPTQ